MPRNRAARHGHGHRPLDRRAFRDQLRCARVQSTGVAPETDAGKQKDRKLKHVSFITQDLITSPTVSGANSLLASGDPEKRVAGWQALREMVAHAGDDTVANVIISQAPKALSDQDAQVRFWVCRTLKRLAKSKDAESHSTEATEAKPQGSESSSTEADEAATSWQSAEAVATCLHHATLDVRLAASFTLPLMPCVGVNDTRVVELAREALSDEVAQVPAIRALTRLGKDAITSCLSGLLAMLSSPSEEEVRAEAALSLYGIVKAEAVEALARALCEDESSMVRLAALSSLQANGSSLCPEGHLLKEFDAPEEYTCNRCEETQPEGAKMRGCRKCDYDLCIACAVQACHTCAIGAVKSAAVSDSNWEVRRAAVQALPKLGQGRAVLASLEDKDEDVRFAALDVLGQLALDGDGDKYAPEVGALLGCYRSDDGAIELQALPDPAPRVRFAAARALGRMCAQSYDASLLPRLFDEDPEVRRWSIWALGRLSLLTPDDELPARVASLTSIVAKDPDAFVRRAAIAALSTMGVVAHSSKLQIAAALANDVDPGVRVSAVDALSSMGASNIASIEGILHAVQDSDRYVRLAAVKLLGTLGTAAAGAASASALASALEHDQSLGMSLACIASLVALGEYAHVHCSVLAVILRASPSEQHVDVRKAAADALGGMGEAGALQASALAAALRNDPSDEVRYPAAWALGELGELAAGQVSEVAAALHDSDADVRDAAARALGAMGTASSVYAGDLANLLQDEHADVRTSAAKALRALGKAARSHATELARVLGSDTSGEVRAAAAAALGAMVEAGHIEELKVALSDDEDDVRVAAIVALGELGEGLPDTATSIAPAVVASFSDSSELVRSFALDALERLGIAGLSYAAEVAGMLGDGDSEVRAAGLRVLTDLELTSDARDAAVTKLEVLSKSEDGEVCACAVEALNVLVDRR